MENIFEFKYETLKKNESHWIKIILKLLYAYSMLSLSSDKH